MTKLQVKSESVETKIPIEIIYNCRACRDTGFIDILAGTEDWEEVSCPHCNYKN